MDLGAQDRDGARRRGLVRAPGAGPRSDVVLKDVDEDDGYERDALIGIRLAQALHHGTDHRSQICTTLTSLGVEPPGIDVWNFGVEVGRVVDVPPPTS